MRRTFFVSALVSVAAVAHGFAQVTPQGPAFQVSSQPASDHYPDVAIAPSGEFVVVWSRIGADGDSYGLLGRRFDSLGNPIGGDFQINTFTAGSQNRPKVAMNGSGEFLVVWDSIGQDAPSSIGVFGQRFDASGARVGPEFQVSDTSVGSQLSPTVSSDRQDDFIVAWENLQFSPTHAEIVTRRFDGATQTLGPELVVSDESLASQYLQPAVAMDGSGGFVVVWGRHVPSNYNYTLLYGRRFDPAGQPAGGEFVVTPLDPTQLAGNYETRIDMNAAGDFVVAWERQLDGVAQKLLVRPFDPNAVPRSDQVLLVYGGVPSRPNVAVASDATFVAAWNDDPGVRAQRFTASGSRLGSEALVDPNHGSFRVGPAIDAHASGSLLMAWTPGGTYARQYLSSCAPPGVPGLSLELVNGGADIHMTWTDVVNAQEYAVFESELPGGGFTTQTGTATTGATGLTVPAPATNRLYLVAGKGLCGFGPLR